MDDPHRRFVLGGDATTSAQLQKAIPVLEVFNGMNVADAGMQAPSTTTGADGLPVLTYSLFANQVPVMLAAYESLRESVYSALVTQTRLKPYLDSIELLIDQNGVQDLRSKQHFKNDSCLRRLHKGYRHKRLVKPCSVRRMSSFLAAS